MLGNEVHALPWVLGNCLGITSGVSFAGVTDTEGQGPKDEATMEECCKNLKPVFYQSRKSLKRFITVTAT